METLDLLEEVLDDYEGTLILVSHDRDFLDRLVSSVIAMEGGGHTVEIAGGYSEYQHYRRGLAQGDKAAAKAGGDRARAKAGGPLNPGARAGGKTGGKLSYKDQRELDQLPKRIDGMTAEIAALESRLADPTLYTKDPAGFAGITRTLDEKRRELHQAEERWLELEAAREALEAGIARNGELTT
jgi:ATP-binding cassette subfamily F protein uup